MGIKLTLTNNFRTKQLKISSKFKIKERGATKEVKNLFLITIGLLNYKHATKRNTLFSPPYPNIPRA